jgi:trehalose-phosphatase
MCRRKPLPTPPDMKPRPHWSEKLPEWRARLRDVPRLLIACDFDGTLSPLVAHPELAVLHADVPVVLEDLAALHPRVRLAVLSGRRLEDLAARLAIRQEGLILAGNHGLEMRGAGLDWVHPAAQALRGTLDCLAGELRAVAARFKGAEVEDKGLSLTLHFRRVAPEDAAGLQEALGCLDVPRGLQRLDGKMIAEFRPRLDWNKGSALRRILQRLGIPGAAAIFAGDDATDEDAFRELGATGLTVHVGPPHAESAACCHAHDPQDVARLFAAFHAVLRGER